MEDGDVREKHVIKNLPKIKKTFIKDMLYFSIHLCLFHNNINSAFQLHTIGKCKENESTDKINIQKR